MNSKKTRGWNSYLDWAALRAGAYNASAPELWEPVIWTSLIERMNPKGVLVTYCAKGQVRRDMQAAGFEVERVEGPPGKREMLRATKP